MIYINDILDYYKFDQNILSTNIHDALSIHGFPCFIYRNVFVFGSIFSLFTLIASISNTISNIEI